MVGGLVWAGWGLGPLAGRHAISVALLVWPLLGVAALVTAWGANWLLERRVKLPFQIRQVDDVGSLLLLLFALAIGVAFAGALVVAVWAFAWAT